MSRGAIPTSPRRLILALALLGTGALALAVGPAGARAEMPWWHLTSGTRPTYLHAGAGKPGKSQVQELFTEPEEFEGHPEQTNFALELNGEGVEEFASEPTAGEFGVRLLSAANIQQALEGPKGYGAGNVSVKEETTDKNGQPLTGGDKRYLITSTGADAESSVPALHAIGEIGTAKVSVLVQGLPKAADGELYVTAENLGDADVEGAKGKVIFKDVVPHGLKASAVTATKPFKEGDFHQREPIPCALEEKAGSQVASCTMSEALAPYDQLEMRLAVEVQPGAQSGELNEVSISGGGAVPALLRRAITISSAPVPYGVEDYEMALEEEGGQSTLQAGAHPFQLTTTLTLNQFADLEPPGASKPEVTAPGMAKDLTFKLPAGLIGSATAVPKCSTAQFFETVGGIENRCPADTAVGVASTTVHEPATVGTVIVTEPIFNLEPREGEPARFGFDVVIANSPVFIDTSVRNGSDYGVEVHVNNITQTAALLSSEATFWGVPSDPRHNAQRGWGCLYQARGQTASVQPCVPSEERHPKPFLSLGTSCSRTLSTSVSGNSWEAPSSFFEVTGAFEPASALGGCNRLRFAPQVKVAPDSEQASRPTGVSFDVHVPQEANESSLGLASSNIRDLTITLPPGVSVNPSSADGLSACSEGEVGYLNETGENEEMLFSATLPEPFCPDSAKVGTATIKTPLLEGPLQGAIYLATPAPNGEAQKNPFASLIALYMVVKDPASGVLVKLPIQVSLNQGTGQISATIKNTPDITFEDAEVHLFDGPRAPLASPDHCGSYPISATFTPWSGTEALTTTASLQVSSGPNGSPCPPAALPFAPTLAAGTANPNAGAFTPLSTSISRQDGSQQIEGVSLHMPPGISGVLSGVTLCPNASAEANSCPQNSLIGHSTVSAGFGPDPFTVPEGKVYLTESYAGAPFGLAISTPAIAGPFDLGTVIVRAKLEVDPHTAALSATTDESGPYAIPHILDGVPLDLRDVNVTIDRPGFTFNPTNCGPQVITGTIKALEGAAAPVSSPFRATACQSLKFAPKFAVSVSGKSSKANGTSFYTKLSYPPGPLGTYANLAKVKVSLPKALPSRLTTLNKACIAQTFEANPEACPKESRVGTAKVMTPLLPVPLTGTAFFVSHAAESFPDLTMVLKGYGITIDLVGHTQIKNGITTTTFSATPDVPFTTFELTLPAQTYSALTTNTNICAPGTKLSMPTEFIAQNGAEIHQSTPIAITGCAKAPTRAELLAKALTACHRKHDKAKRKSCEASARKRYASKRPKAKKGAKKQK